MQVGRNVNKQIDFLCPIRPEEESQWSGTRAQHQVDWGDLVRRKRERILGILKPKSAEESRFPAHRTGCSLTQVLLQRLWRWACCRHSGRTGPGGGCDRVSPRCSETAWQRSERAPVATPVTQAPPAPTSVVARACHTRFSGGRTAVPAEGLPPQRLGPLLSPPPPPSHACPAPLPPDKLTPELCGRVTLCRQ